MRPFFALFAGLAVLCAAPLAAQDDAAPAAPVSPPPLPALYDVTGVTPGDVLNIRTAPDAAAEKIGELAPDAIAVEVTAIDAEAGWGRVNTEERAGWASLDFLTRQETGAALPDVARMMCFGTEPFWNIDLDAGGLSNFSEPESEALFLTGPVRPGEGRPDRFAVVGGAAGSDLALSISVEECSDGMSDRLYGLSATMIVSGSVNRTLSGCCALQGVAQ
ncbi:COG3650 family protein [Roseivivax sediminis]|uniref:SH3 domain-containing protein n=1 Tax=Roseivivax sediminis TaxID=936889 RepID=A0A1I2B634_9RHOB|nr:SH3 domain-containing protein [Roseivivax sediminis]SFE50610.1 hypothetical protein SAMN04515678_110175 [Roseivivax sediminis]